MSEPEKPKRRLWQVHLSTAVLMTIVAGCALRFAAPSFQSEEWNLTDSVSDFKSSLKRAGNRYLMDIKLGGGWESELIIANPDGTTLRAFSIEAGDQTPFILSMDVLYYAIYSPIATGCRIAAVDLKSGSQLWTTNLQGIGPVSHSIYANKVYMRLRGNCIIVYGDEASGKYIETIDVENGKIISNSVIDGGLKMSPVWLQSLLALIWIVAPVMLLAVLMEYCIRRREAR